MAPFRSARLQWLAALAVVCLLAPAARGDFFAGYTPARHNRFTTGTTANPTFILAGHEFERYRS